MKFRTGDAVEAALGLAALSLFVVYFGLHCFRYPWAGDILRHSAAVASLDRDFLHPSHESMPVSGNQSEVHTPYLVSVAAMGRALGVSPYRALQLAGVANLIFYAWAVWFFFRTFSLLSGSFLPPVVFLVVSLFLRNRNYWWASETGFASMRLIQAYPSLFAWGAALTVFALVERYFRRPRATLLAVVALIVWALVLSHSLTGSWVVGIVTLRLLFAAFARNERRPALALAAAVGTGVALTLAWPYFDIRASAGLRHVREGSEFGDHPFRDMAGLYALALPAAVAFACFRKHLFWIAGFAATLGALHVFRSVGFDYGNRYAFFQAFFAQALVAEAAAFGITAALGRRDRLPANFPVSAVLRAMGFAYAGAVVLLTATALRRQKEAGNFLLSVRELLAQPSTHDDYYRQLGEVGPGLGATDVVLMPVEHLAWNVSSITGARTVASLFAYRVPDFATRVQDISRFFAAGLSRDERAEILRRYGVTKVLLTPPVRGREAELTLELGSPIARTPSLVLFEARR